MDIKRYRDAHDAEIKSAADEYQPAPAGDTEALLSERASSAKERVAAIESTRLDAEDLSGLIGQYLRTAVDRREAVGVRLAAIDALRQGDFLGAEFAAHRAEYHQALREIATDRSPKLRREALEILAIEKDSFAQDKLLEGLKDPDVALVPAWKAVQLLAYDDHGEAVPTVRDLFEDADVLTQEEALSLLASDPGSEELLVRLLQDKSRPSTIRQRSAAALQNLNPSAFQRVARDIVTDDGDENEIRASCLASLTSDSVSGGISADFVEQVSRIPDKTKSRNLRSSVKRFLQAADKYS